MTTETRENALALRPMTIPDILDAGIELYRRNFVRFLIPVLIINGPIWLLAQLVGYLSSLVVPQTGEVPSIPGILLVAAFGLALLFLVIVGHNLLGGTMIWMLSERYLDRRLDISAAFGRAFKRLIPLIVVGFISALAFYVALSLGVAVAVLFVMAMVAIHVPGVAVFFLTFFFFVLCMYPAIKVFLGFLFVSPAVMIENLGIFNAISRSWRLMGRKIMPGFFHSNVMRVSALLAAVIALTFGVGILSQAPSTVAAIVYIVQSGSEDIDFEDAFTAELPQLMPTWLYIPVTVLSFVIGQFAAPYLVIAGLLFYYDVRIRSEGFDLDVMAEELASTNA